MADADSGMGSHREGRQERTEQPRQPGAKGKGDQGAHSPEEARDEAQHRRGKTRQNSSGETDRA